MADYCGYTGKILQVDLTTREITTTSTFDYVPDYIGGVGLCAKIHWDMVGPDVEGLDPENVLTIMTSPTMGTPVPGGQKTVVGGVAPHMYPKQTFLKSVFGGMWGPELKYAGWDGIIIKGASAVPVYLLIEDEKIEILDATTLWGLDTQATQMKFFKRYSKDHRVITIGPAGENLVSDAVILTDDSNTAGKGGFGAVMGSKKLKAVVVRGTGGVTMARPKEVLDCSYEAQRLMTRKEYEKETSHSFRGSLFGPLSVEGNDLYKAGKEGKDVRTGYAGCMMCPIACGMSIKFKDGSNEGTGHIMCVECNAEPEEMAYNNENFGRAAFARLKEHDKLGYSVWANHLDIWPLFTYGVLTNKDMEIEAPVGSVEFARELVRKISYREGLGEELAKGRAHFLNDFIGTEPAKILYQMQAATLGQSRLTTNYAANFFGPIGWTGACVSRGRDNDLTWAIANTVADPRVVVQGSKGYNDMQELFAERTWGSKQAAVDARNHVFGDYTAAQAYTGHNMKAWVDSVGSCSTFLPHVSMYSEDHMGSWDVMRRILSAVTGADILSAEDEKLLCDRVWMLERCIGVREGQTREDDWFFDSIFEDESYKAFGLSREALSKAIDQYYELRGLDIETGIPRKSTLEALGMGEIANRLEQEYSIALKA